VILNGSQLPLFTGVDVDELFGYEYSDSSWKQIPIQIDEVDSDGEYGPEDGLLDGNDEVVFMAIDTGESVNPTQWIGDADSQQYPRHQVEVTNPLDTSDRGWVYIYRSATLTPPSADYVSWNEADQLIAGGTYTVGLNTTDFLGLDSFKVNGNDTDILDRSKFRVSATCLFIPINLTEESSLIIDLIPDITPEIDGPVRVGGGGLSLANIWAYHSLFNVKVGMNIDDLDVSDICVFGFAINSVRVSLDLLDPSSSGMSPTTYFDSNTSGVVDVDGVNDSVPTNAKTWS
jgi:gamma-glutamylcyclotransferase (GGCT)/AIG2-like uncharacterized protein YtfP